MACLTRRVRIGVARLRASPPVALGSASSVMPFVGGQQRDPGLPQLVLDLRAEVGDAGEPVHGLADHRDEPAVGVARLLQ
jgi:hypothetical protein